MKKLTLHTTRTARIFVSGELNETTEKVWLIWHGYGQLAERFINKFEVLVKPGTAVVMPEALQRFYVDGITGKVGASWMTRTERETDILDNHTYLDNVLEKVKSSVSEHCHFYLLGFSQGTATMCRWLAHRGLKPDALILWAGMWPTDLKETSLGQLLQNVPVFMVLGKNDPYGNTELMNNQIALTKSWGIEIEVIAFDGEHAIDEPTLLKIEKQFTS